MKKEIKKEDIIELYINQNLSKEKVLKQLHISINTLNDLLREFNIVKSKELLDKAKTSGNNNFFKSVLNRIDKNEFIDLYINQNKSHSFLQEYYSITSWTLDKLIRYYDCHKSRQQSAKLVLETKYNNYGSKEEYDNHVHEQMIENLKSKGISLEEHYKKVSTTCKRKWKSKTKEEINSINNQRSITCMEKYGYAFSCMRPEARIHGNNSKPNIKFAEKLDKNNIHYQREFAIDRFQYDFKIDNILVEINPTITHNSTFSVRKDGKPLDKNYHYQKSKLARDNGYHCICIWDWDDWDKIISLLLPRKTIGARKCEIKDVDLNTAREYLNEHLTYFVKNYITQSIICTIVVRHLIDGV